MITFVPLDIKADAYDIWCIGLAIKLHFEPESGFDAIKYSFKGPKVSHDKFDTLPMRYAYEKLAKQLVYKNEVILYVLANVIAGNNFIADYSDDVYLKWQSRIQSLEYNFKADMKKLAAFCNEEDVTFDEALLPANRNNPPKIYSAKLWLETLASLDYILHYTEHQDKYLNDPLDVSSDTIKMIQAYTPFIKSLVDVKTLPRIITSAFS